MNQLVFRQYLNNLDLLINLVGVVELYPESSSFYGELKEKPVPVYTNMDDLFSSVLDKKKIKMLKLRSIIYRIRRNYHG